MEEFAEYCHLNQKLKESLEIHKKLIENEEKKGKDRNV